MIRAASSEHKPAWPADDCIEFIGGPWDGHRVPAPLLYESHAGTVVGFEMSRGGVYHLADSTELALVWVPLEEQSSQ
jgi:hypothetical protein